MLTLFSEQREIGVHAFDQHLHCEVIGLFPLAP